MSVARASRVPRPLPFDPRGLTGLSERLLVSHHENNYGGALRNLDRAEQELTALPADAPPFVVGALRERILTFRNSVVLHELYFGNLGGGGQVAGEIAEALARSFGSADAALAHLRTTGMSLAGGSGWAILGLDLHAGGELVVAWSGHHSQLPGQVLPLLVLDMYEHSYHLDYGAAAAKYLDAFF